MDSTFGIDPALSLPLKAEALTRELRRHKNAADVMDSPATQHDRDPEHLGTGIITTAILLIIGYIVISKVIGLAFRLIVPAILILVLAGAGLFSGFVSDHKPTGQYEPYGHVRHSSEEGGSLGDMRLRDIADGVVDMTRSILRETLALLDRPADSRSPEPFPLYPDRRHPPRDQFDEAPAPGDPARWDAPYRPERAY